MLRDALSCRAYLDGQAPANPLMPRHAVDPYPGIRVGIVQVGIQLHRRLEHCLATHLTALTQKIGNKNIRKLRGSTSFDYVGLRM